jgi:hypothetical protein
MECHEDGAGRRQAPEREKVRGERKKGEGRVLPGGAGEGERFQVDVEELGGEAAAQGGEPRFLGERQEARERAGDGHVGRARVADFGRDRVRVDAHKAVAEEAREGRVGILRRGLEARGDGDRHEVAAVDERAPGGAHERERADGLDFVERDEDVGLAVGDDGREDAVAEAHLARHRAAALAHAVDFALLHIEPGFRGRAGENVGREQDALPADSDEGDVGGVHLLTRFHVQTL